MAAEVPSIEPTTIIAGDTVAWTRDLSDYPASTWTLTYYLTGPSRITIAATASGQTHSVSKSAATTATWAEGNYDWQAFVSSGSSRYKIAAGKITILENPATAGKTYDSRTPAKQTLDALQAAALSNAGRGEQEYRIEAAGRTHRFYTHADLIAAIEYYKSVVLREEKALKIARGDGPGNRVLLRFK